MTLKQRSEAAGNRDGSFGYRGYSVEPMTSHPAAGVNVYDGSGPIRFDSWAAAKRWIDERESYDEEDDAG